MTDTTVTAPATPRPSVCGERAQFTDQLAAKALDLAGRKDPETEDLLIRDLRCTLESHALGDHFSFVMELDGPTTGALWATWTRGHHPTHILALPDCDATDDRTHEPCSEFSGHTGAHTYHLTDPWTTTPPAKR